MTVNLSSPDWAVIDIEHNSIVSTFYTRQEAREDARSRNDQYQTNKYRVEKLTEWY